MHLRTDNARPSVRPALEALEARTLPSATVPAPTTLAGASVQTTTSTTVQVDYAHAAAVTAPATNATFSSHWAISPSAVLVGTSTATATRRSTGSVAFALARDSSAQARVGGAAVSVLAGTVTTTSSANPSNPDRYQTPFTLGLRLRDAASGSTWLLTFKGTVTGTVNYQGASLKLTFQNPTVTVPLGRYSYTVSLPSSVTLGGPNSAPTAVYAHVSARLR